MSHKHKNRSGNLLFPIILIIVGIAFLLQNLGLLGANVWDTLFHLWPLFLILLGFNELSNNHGIVGPTISIGLGSIFLGNNLGFLDWDVWMTMWRLWPIIIIAIGLEIFIGRKNIWLSTLGVGMTLGLLAVVLWFSGGVHGVEAVIEPTENTRVISEKIEQPLDDAESAYVEIESSVGKLVIDSLSDDDLFVKGEIYSSNQEKIVEKYKISGDKITYLLQSEWDSDKITDFSDFNNNEHLSWEISLTEEIPLFLDFSLGVGESELDLRDLQIDQFNLSVGVGQTIVSLPVGKYQAQIEGGVGQTIVHLPKKGQIELDVDGGVGEIVIYIPEGTAAKISVDRGIAALKIPTDYDKEEDLYTSPNYDKKKDYVMIYITQGIGNISVREE